MMVNNMSKELIPGDTKCNRKACDTELSSKRMWNTETQSFYCVSCARRINESSIQSLGREICISEWKKNNNQTDKPASESNRVYLKYHID